MEFKKPRESLVQNITFMAMMAAINVVFVVLTTFVPVLVFLIVFILPLTSVLVTLHCKKIYFPIYAVATIGLCLICTIWQIDDTIFYAFFQLYTVRLFKIDHCGSTGHADFDLFAGIIVFSVISVKLNVGQFDLT